MKFMEFLDKIENYNCPFDLQDVEVRANKVGNVSVLYFLHQGMIFDCIILEH